MSETHQADAAAVPEVGSVADLVPESLPDTYLSWVEAVTGAELLVSGPVDAQLRPVTLPVGERLDLVWRGADGLHSLPVELVAIEASERPRWRLVPAGVVKRGQRRDAVRAPLTAEVIVGTGAKAVRATTVDVSEGGLRCVLERRPAPGSGSAVDGAPAAPSVGEVVQVAAALGQVTVRCSAEVARRHPRDDDRVELSLRFIGLSDYEQDRVRQVVFGRLRELRRRGLL